jgi:hypothetical protein
MSPLYTALFSWAVSLSGLPPPPEPPIVLRKPHSFFVEHACGGKECRVYGWYAGGRKLYIEQSMDPEKNLIAASVVVHEMVHYLQASAGNGLPHGGAAFRDKPGCEAALDMERQAYAVQREYLRRYGSIEEIGVAMQNVSCK